jgi:xanthine/CO dehydrogenase XdhC/CoxF family maturation factor
LVWTRAPFLFRNELVAVEGLDEERPAGPHEMKRLGDHPVIARLRTEDGAAEVAVRDDDRALLLGPYQEPGATVAAGQPPLVLHP